LINIVLLRKGLSCLELIVRMVFMMCHFEANIAVFSKSSYEHPAIVAECDLAFIV